MFLFYFSGCWIAEQCSYNAKECWQNYWFEKGSSSIVISKLKLHHNAIIQYKTCLLINYLKYIFVVDAKLLDYLLSSFKSNVTDIFYLPFPSKILVIDSCLVLKNLLLLLMQLTYEVRMVIIELFWHVVYGSFH